MSLTNLLDREISKANRQAATADYYRALLTQERAENRRLRAIIARLGGEADRPDVVAALKGVLP